MFYKNPLVSHCCQKDNFSTYDQHNYSLTSITNNFSQYQPAYQYCNTPSASNMPPKKLPKDIKKPSQGNDKPPKDGDKPANDDKKSTKDGKGPARDEGQRESSRPPTARERTNTESSTGGGKLKSIASSLGGSPSKSGSKAATSEGNVKLFKSIKGNDGKVSPKKLLGVIFENMTVTPAMRGRKFTATAPKEQSVSPPSPPVKSNASSKSTSKGDDRSEGSENWPADAASVPVSNLGFHDPKDKTKHLLWWFLPYDRESSNHIATWYDVAREQHRHYFASMEACRAELKEWLKNVKALNKEPGEKQPFTIVLYLEHKIDDYDDQVFQDVMASLDEILKQGNGLKIEVLVRFHDPSIDSEEDMLPTMNYVQVILMLLQDKYDEDGQTKTDAIIARAIARRGSDDDQRRFSSDDGGSRSGRHGRGRGRQGHRTGSKASERDSESQDREDRGKGRVGQIGRTGQVGHTSRVSSRGASVDSVGSGGSDAPGVRQKEELWESGKEGFHDEFRGWGGKRQY